MAEPRAPIRNVLQSPVSGSAIVGGNMTVTKHVAGGELGAGEAATIYKGETTSETAATNELTSDSKGTWTQGSGSGFAEYYLPVGRYDLKISGAGLTTYYLVQDFWSAAGESVETGNIKALAVTTAKVAAEAITAPKIATGAVQATKIENGAVGTNQIGAGQVNTNNLANGGITAAKLAAEAVETGGIKNSAVTRAKLSTEVQNAVFPEGSYSHATEYSKAEAEAGLEPSATRKAFVVLSIQSAGSEHINAVVLCGGIEIAYPLLVAPSGTFNVLPCPSFICPAGQKWQVTGSFARAYASYLLM